MARLESLMRQVVYLVKLGALGNFSNFAVDLRLVCWQARCRCWRILAWSLMYPITYPAFVTEAPASRLSRLEESGVGFGGLISSRLLVCSSSFMSMVHNIMTWVERIGNRIFTSTCRRHRWGERQLGVVADIRQFRTPITWSEFAMLVIGTDTDLYPNRQPHTAYFLRYAVFSVPS